MRSALSPVKAAVIGLLLLAACHKKTATPQTVKRAPYKQTYTAFDNSVYFLYTYEGKYVSLMMMDSGLDTAAMYRWVTVMDSCYSYYRSVTGRVPDIYQNTFLNNRSTIAEVASTCGAGCGYLGYTGIEMLKDYSDRMYNYILTDNQYDQELFYEFGRNFWFYGGQLAYANPNVDPVATGYAVFMRFMAMDATKVTPAPFNATPWADFRSAEEGLVDVYVSNAAYNWSNTLGANAGVGNPLGLGATDLVSSFLMRLTKNYGGSAFVNKF